MLGNATPLFPPTAPQPEPQQQPVPAQPYPALVDRAAAAASRPQPGPVGPPAAMGPAPTPVPAPPIALDLSVIRKLRTDAADLLHKADRATPLSDVRDREQRGRKIIAGVVAQWSDLMARERRQATSPAEDQAVAEAVFNWLFAAGPLEPYLADPLVENIHINGHDDVWVDYADRPRTQVPPLTATEDELRDLIRELARRHGSGERMMSTASPTLALRLPDGSRLQAVSEVTEKIYVTIRRHRVRDVSLGGLVELGMLDATLAAFLAALIRARRNIVICGTQGVGKTSLLRALAREIPADERIGTFETEYELQLDKLGVHRQVVAFEAREGNGERSADGRSAGEVTIGDLIPDALRMSLSRMIVGEVRSSEIVPMLRVMTTGEGGSMCTLHVREPDMVWDRVAELCLEHGHEMTDRFAYRLAANAINYIVFLRLVDETWMGGKRHRFVSHVFEMAGLGEHGRPTTNRIFAPSGADPRAVPQRVRPSDLDLLRRVGFDPSLLERPPSWGPLNLKSA